MINVLYEGYDEKKKTVDTRAVLRGDCPRCQAHRMLSVRLRHNPDQDIAKAVVEEPCRNTGPRGNGEPCRALVNYAYTYGQGNPFA